MAYPFLPWQDTSIWRSGSIVLILHDRFEDEIQL